jgi:hypothetical protein
LELLSFAAFFDELIENVLPLFYLYDMATVKEVILKEKKRDDGTWNLKIRIIHNRRTAYISTSHYVGAKQIRKDFSIKDPFIEDLISPVIANYRKKISSLGAGINSMTAKDVADFLKKEDTPSDVHFINFAEKYIFELKSNDKIGSARNMQTVVYSLIDFFGTRDIFALDITAHKLFEIEAYLRKPRTLKRKHSSGGEMELKRAGSTTAGIHTFMRDLRLLFNAARDKYNDEDTGKILIAHYPFRKYKIAEAPAPIKRNLTLEQIKAIRDFEIDFDGRMKIARDLFMLSFYLCGMNAVDLYKADKFEKGRINYNRSKTEGRRKDKAFISIKVPTESLPLTEKYFGKLSSIYTASTGLGRVISYGLNKLTDAINDHFVKEHGIKLFDVVIEFYMARHSFANFARNICRFSKDDIALALNHIDLSRKTTDIYISPDWSIIDQVQKGVLDLLKEKGLSTRAAVY